MQKSQRAKRMEKRHNRAKRSSTQLNVVSLMDIFTILVFFLLVNSSDVEVLPDARDVQLPQSIAEEKPEVNVVILVGEDEILVQGRPVARVADVLAMSGNDIPALREALLAQNERELGKGGDDVAGREVTIMGDKDIPYRLLKKVMATCTAADYGQISLAVLQKSSDQLDRITAARQAR
jgi:biopolymer transport protein TolR